MHRVCLYIILLLAGCHSASTINYPPGGDSYPESFSPGDTNFYFYPLKARDSRKDSFYDAGDSLLFQTFHEPNLSLRPQPSATFRLTYTNVSPNLAVITLTRDGITVKKGTTYNEECTGDTLRLTPLERTHYHLLETGFPIEANEKRSARWQRYLDSMVQLYPVLHDPAYYRYLLSKLTMHKRPCLDYRQQQIKITGKQFDSLVHHINASGFWQLQDTVAYAGDWTDSYEGFILEANTPEKYKVVKVLSVDDNRPFRQAWQELIKLAGLDSTIHLYPVETKVIAEPGQTIVRDVQLEEVHEPVPPHRRKSKH